jgi:integrase
MQTTEKKERGIYEKVKGSGQFYIRWADASGKMRKEKAGTLAVARKLLVKRKNESQIERKLPSLTRRRVRFSELTADMLEHSKRNNRPYTVYNNELRVKRLLPDFGERFADDIRPQEIERWLSAHTATPATNNRYHATLSLIFRLAVQNRKIDNNPLASIKKRREDNKRLRFLTIGEESKIRGYIQANWPHHWSAVELALNTGMRQGEQFNLRWQDADLERRIITLQTTKNGKPRHIPLNDAAIAALQAAHSLANQQPWVFLNRYGEQHTSPRTWFDKTIKELKLTGVTWHTLRHTFASRLAMAGVPLIAIKELMGHKTIEMTLRYAHLAPEHNLAAVQMLCDTQKRTDPRTDPRTETVQTVASSRIN